MKLLKKLKCILGMHESFSYEEWERVCGHLLLKRRLSPRWTLRDWLMAVDRTQELWIRTCCNCGKRR